MAKIANQASVLVARLRHRFPKLEMPSISIPPQLIVIPSAVLVAQIIPWTPELVTAMAGLLMSISAGAVAILAYLYVAVFWTAKDTSQIWIKRPQDSNFKKELMRRGILRRPKRRRNQKKTEFEKMYYKSTYFRQESKMLSSLALSVVFMTVIGVGLPLTVDIYPPLIVQMFLIPITVYRSPVVQARLINGLSDGCYDEVTEKRRAKVAMDVAKQAEAEAETGG